MEGRTPQMMLMSHRMKLEIGRSNSVLVSIVYLIKNSTYWGYQVTLRHGSATSHNDMAQCGVRIKRVYT